MTTAREVTASIRNQLEREHGTILKDAPERVALLYPSPYSVGMSSLGFQTIYREIHSRAGRSAERAFLPDEDDTSNAGPVLTYEHQRPVGEFPVLAFSVAFELELSGVARMLELAGVPPLSADRDERHPIILGGGPLTFSNPLPLAPFVDAVLLGEADETIHGALDAVFSAPNRTQALAALKRNVPSAYVPMIDGDELPHPAACDNAKLPAYSQILTPDTELRNMFLIETERGCSRGCTYCVMRRSTNGGMRLVPMERILGLIPDHAKRVGLVGAAVSDHPEIADIVETLAAQGRQVGLSSLRPDRLNDRFAAALRAGGYQTLTTASDGASQRLRDSVQRRARENHLLKAAELARTHGFHRLKLYMMVGLPDENDADIDELIRFTVELSAIVPTSLGIAPFVAKRNTPLDGQPFAGIDVVEDRLERLRHGVKGRVELRSTSARWAWVEYVLAQGGQDEGRAVLDATRAGGKWRHYKQAFDALPSDRRRRALRVVA